MWPDRDLIHPTTAFAPTAWPTSGTASRPRPPWVLDTSSGRSTAPSAGPGRRPRTSGGRFTDLLVSQLSELAAHAGDHGVVLGVEPLNRFETSFLNLASQAIEVVDRVGHPACGLLLDTFHMNIEERSIGDAIRAAGPRLRHLHACENDRGAPGTGHVPWAEVARRLRDIGYDQGGGHRVLHQQGEVDRARRGDLASARREPGRAGDRGPAEPADAVRRGLKLRA